MTRMKYTYCSWTRHIHCIDEVRVLFIDEANILFSEKWSPAGEGHHEEHRGRRTGALERVQPQRAESTAHMFG